LDVLLVTLDPETDEICALLASAGHHVIETILQRRDHPDPRTFVGRGKLDELRERVEEAGVKVVVFNGELRPTMHHLLERELHVECYDRLRVLLELFAQRAWTRDGKLQVELALLQYEVPLLREWIHEADIGERPGFMAGGEQRVDAYYETVKRRIKKIRDELERIRREREVRRTLRKDRGYHLVALAGYANAGKTSLLNALTDEHLLVDDRMFSTLATTTRSLTGTRKRILLTDTIGFVDGVPFWMVEAFHATLEEILQADLVLLLVDGTDSESEMRRKVRLAARTLFPKVPADSILPVLTKIDRVAEDRIEDQRKVLAESEFHRSPLAISGQDGRGLAALREAIQTRFAYPIETHLVLAVDAETPGKMHWLYEHADVLTAVHHADRIELVLRCRPRDRALVGQTRIRNSRFFSRNRRS
jgi:GTP-binding protein HflX